MKKNRFLLLMAAAVSISFSSFAQDVKEIISKHNKAVGGTEKWNTIKSLRKEGAIEIMGTNMPVTLTILKGKGMRQDFTVMGTSNNYMIVTPAAGWIFIPAQGHTEPQPLPADQLKDAAAQLDFQDKLMEAAAKKYKIVLDGKEDVAGIACFKLKITGTDQQESVYYIDAKTWYLVKTAELIKANGTETELVVSYSDYKKLPSGIVVAFKEESSVEGSMNFTKIEANTVKDESIFKP